MNDGNAKQQIVEKIKSSSNILVTVSRNPSVDELSAALGLTVLLNKMNKHATAVFSGAIPPAITFLDPQKTFENTVDSLRDFIIALDKEKADHLRYKVDGDVVKIFITPYRTTISSDDLDFSQGDYNVELVLALGVKDQDDLDGALAAHGRILHDAAVVTMSAGEMESQLGSIDWREENASSLSEMLVSLSDGLKGDKALLDEQIATSFLTGIVAATDRFSNNRTSSKVMTIAAQLMSAGANQQLIASKLEEAHEIGPDAPTGGSGSSDKSENSDGTVDMNEGESTKVNKKAAKTAKKAADEPKKDDGSLTISHEKEGDIDEVAAATAAEEQEKATQAAQDELEKRTKEVREGNQQDAAKTAEETLAKQLAGVAPGAAAAGSSTLSVADMQKDLAAANAEVDEAATKQPATVQKPLSGAVSPDEWQTPGSHEPSMGGTLNATTEQAAEDERHALEDDRNHTILSHNSGSSYVGSGAMPTFQSPLNAASQPEEDAPIIDPLASSSSNDTPAPTAYAHTVQPPAETLEDIDKHNRAPHEEARAAIDAAFNAAPPASSPMSSLPPVQPESQPAPAAAAPPSASLPPLPPMPDFSTLPPLPPMADATQPAGAVSPEKLEDIFGATPSTPAPAAPAQPQSNDPGQFKIPGQS
jgi:hypothetical protein